MEHNLEVGAADFTAHAHPPRSAPPLWGRINTPIHRKVHIRGLGVSTHVIQETSKLENDVLNF